MKTGNALCGLIFFVYILNIYSIEEKVCKGIEEFYREQYFMLKRKLQNCTYIKGSLSLYKLQPGDDLSFLKSIRVIEGYLHIRSNGAPIIPLDNLQIIMGRELAPRSNPKYALIISDNAYEGRENELSYEQYEVEKDPYLINETAEAKRIRMLGGAVPAYTFGPNNIPDIIMASTLHTIQFYSLSEILRGGVYIDSNPSLCYLMATINWTDIVTGLPEESPIYINNVNNHKPFEDESKHQICPPLPQACSPTCKSGLCWDYDHCQTVFSRDCYKHCSKIFPFNVPNYKTHLISPRCRGPTHRDCCDPECAGSCSSYTNKDCTACRHFNDTVNDRCVAQCPFDRLLPPGSPFRLYTYGHQCVSRCPLHYLSMDGLCLRTCPDGYIEGRDPSDSGNSYDTDTLTCLKMDCSTGNVLHSDPFGTTPHGLAYAAHCPRSCETVIDLFAQNIARITDCQIIEGELSILEKAFSPRRHFNNVTHDVMLRPLNLPELDVLRSVRKIGGNLRIQHFPPSIESLEFFDNLFEISGRETLMFEKFCLYIVNTQLRYTGLRSLAWLPGGGLGFENNTRLCYNDPGFDYPLNPHHNENVSNTWMTLTQSAPPPDSLPSTYYRRYLTRDGRTIKLLFTGDRNESECVARSLTCYDQCSTRSYPSILSPALERRCWGPGAHMCFDCASQTLLITLRNHTLVHDVINSLSFIVDIVNLAEGLNKSEVAVLRRIVANATSQISGKARWDIDRMERWIKPSGGARLLNFYGDSVKICVPDCQHLSSPNESSLAVYESLLAVLEQIKPNARPSITGEDELTFADIKLSVLKTFKRILGSTLGITHPNGTILESMKMYAFKHYYSDPHRSHQPVSSHGFQEDNYLCRLCHPECSLGCKGPSASECLGCKHYRLPSTFIEGVQKEQEGFTCLRICPDGYYHDHPFKLCKPCHANCYQCTGPESHLNPNGCSRCKLLHRTPNGQQVCLSGKCPDGYHSSNEHGQDYQSPYEIADQESKPKECLPCADVCSTCNGPSPLNCIRCIYMRFERACFKECPFIVWGVDGLNQSATLEIEELSAKTDDRVVIATAFGKYERCPCDPECMGNLCSGPRNWQCERCKNVALETKLSLPESEFYKWTCLNECPRDKPKVLILPRQNIRLCRMGDGSILSLYMLKFSAVPLVLILLVTLAIILLQRRRREKQVKTKAKEFKQLLASLNKLVPANDQNGIFLSNLGAPTDLSEDVSDEILNTAHNADDERITKISANDLTHVKSLENNSFFAQHTSAFWYHSGLSKNVAVAIKILDPTLLPSDPDFIAFEGSMAKLLGGVFGGGTRNKNNRGVLTGGPHRDTQPLTRLNSATSRSSSPHYYGEARRTLVPVYGITGANGNPVTACPSYSCTTNSSFVANLLKKLRRSDKSSPGPTALSPSDHLLGDEPLRRPLTLVTQLPRSGMNLKTLFLRLRTEAIARSLEGSGGDGINCNGGTGWSEVRGNIAEPWYIMKNYVPRWCVQIADAMNYLSRNNIVHANLSSRCIQLYTMDQVKVDDYYYHSLLTNNGRVTRRRIVEDYMQQGYKWMAMETFVNHEFSLKTDVWSFGVTLWEIFTFGFEPYESMDFEKHLEQIRSGYRLPQPNTIDALLYQNVIKCWLEHPQIRLSFEELHHILSSFAKHPDQHYFAERMKHPLWHEVVPGRIVSSTLSRSNPQSINIAKQKMGSVVGTLRKGETIPRPHYQNYNPNPKSTSKISSTSWPATEYYTEILGEGGNYEMPPPFTRPLPSLGRGNGVVVSDEMDEYHVYQYPDYLDIIGKGNNNKCSDIDSGSSYLSPASILHLKERQATAKDSPLSDQAFNIGPRRNGSPNILQLSNKPQSSSTFHHTQNSGHLLITSFSDCVDGNVISPVLLSNPSPSTKRNLKLYIPSNLSETFI